MTNNALTVNSILYARLPRDIFTDKNIFLACKRNGHVYATASLMLNTDESFANIFNMYVLLFLSQN